MPAPGQKNDCGVYTPHETLELPMPRKGWRGMPLADIDLVQTPEGWRSCFGYQFMTGDCCGRGSPLTDHDRAFPTRELAVSHSATALRKIAARRADREAKLVLEWLDNLEPVQADLFALL
ncbi:hypothetical protein D3Y57_06995 [Sphingomonas paeninsulae]|uniref:Uncharacterized protein n=2 Tax=Sphingomonas paeninsulae TaxID=2319844 RepID=A0A494TEM7_SPHPE|nr:hypothetical protein D3Y57_06995 [Sphingomonas paeninsulae]